MPFGIVNKTRAFVFRLGINFVELSVGFTKEIVFNFTHPEKAGAIDLIEAKTIETIPITSDSLAKTVSTVAVTTLSSYKLRGKIFSVIAGATSNLI